MTMSHRAILLHSNQFDVEMKNLSSIQDCKKWFQKKLRKYAVPDKDFPYGFETMILEHRGKLSFITLKDEHDE